jgi:hypothetical protein
LSNHRARLQSSSSSSYSKMILRPGRNTPIESDVSRQADPSGHRGYSNVLLQNYNGTLFTYMWGPTLMAEGRRISDG